MKRQKSHVYRLGTCEESLISGKVIEHLKPKLSFSWGVFLYRLDTKPLFCLVRMQITPRELDVNRCEEF